MLFASSDLKAGAPAKVEGEMEIFETTRQVVQERKRKGNPNTVGQQRLESRANLGYVQIRRSERRRDGAHGFVPAERKSDERDGRR